MGMFLNYHTLTDNYIPNNLSNRFKEKLGYSALAPNPSTRPYEEYDVKGNLIGFSWSYGDSVELEFNIDGEIPVENDTLFFIVPGQSPNEQTVGRLNQRAYNLVDCKFWKCVSILEDSYVWVEDNDIYSIADTTQSMYISAEKYLQNKFVEVTIYNFRLEPVHTEKYVATSKIIFSILPELSKEFVRGIYYCTVKVFDETSSDTIFDTTDGCLLVK